MKTYTEDSKKVTICGESYSVEGTIKPGMGGIHNLTIHRKMGPGRISVGLVYDLELEELIELLEALLAKVKEVENE
jgi:hypothetical protein